MATEQYFLETLFAQLNTVGLRYAVLRNYETLPGSAGGSDLDILIHPEDAHRAREIVVTAVERCGGTLIGCVWTWNFFEAYAYGVKDGLWWGLCVELYTEVKYKSCVSLVDSARLDACIAKHNRISVVPRDIGNTIGLIKEVLAHDEFRSDKPKYLVSAKKMYSSNHEMFHGVFGSLGKSGLLLLPRVLESESKQAQTVAIRRFRRAVLSHAFCRAPFSFLYRRAVHEYHRVKRIVRPSGAVIAILGVDGAGKSTVIDAVKPVLDSATHNAAFILHLRPGLLPPLARLKGKVAVPDGPVTDPHGSTPSGVIGSVLRLTWLTLDYVFGYWLTIRLIISKRPAVVIFDRYAYDMALDPRRFRIGLPGWVAGLFARLAPRPDLIICLHAKPEVIAARKQELPVEETRRQIQALLAFAETHPNAVAISTDGCIEEVRERSSSSIVRFLSEKSPQELPEGPLRCLITVLLGASCCLGNPVKGLIFRGLIRPNEPSGATN